MFLWGEFRRVILMPGDMDASSKVDYYAVLGLKRQLHLEADAVRERFQQLSREAHPDAGSGSEEAYANLVTADSVLRDRARRVIHWMELHGVVHDPRAVSPSAWVPDTFGAVAEVVKSAADLKEKHENVTSALGRAVLDREKVILTDRVGALLEELRGRAGTLDERLATLDSGEEVDIEEISRLAVDAGFLQRWIDQLRSTMAGLV